MTEIKLLLFAQGLRFLLFDYKLFRPIRDKVINVPVLSTLLRCPFCQGFWCGFFAFLPLYEYCYLEDYLYGIFQSFMWGLGSGIIALTWYALVIPKLDEIEGDK